MRRGAFIRGGEGRSALGWAVESMSNAKLSKGNPWVPDMGAKGWGICLAAMAYYYIAGSVMDTGMNALFSVYELQGFSRTGISAAMTVGGWLSILSIVAFGAVNRKFGTSAMTVAGLLGTAASFAIIAFAPNFAAFAVGIAGFYVFSCAYGVVAIGSLGANWFPKKKGMYMAIATMGTTLGSASISAIMFGLVGAVGLRAMWLIFAGVCVALAVVTGLFVKNNPEEAGAFPDNDRGESPETARRALEVVEEYKARSPWKPWTLLRTRGAWTLALGWSIPQLAAMGFLIHMTGILQAFGHNVMFGITLLGVMWPFGLLSHYVCGVCDRAFGTKKTSIGVCCVLICGAALLLFAQNAVCAAAGVAIYMAGVSANMNVFMSMTMTIYGRYDFEAVWPTLNVISQFVLRCGAVVVAAIGEAIGFVNVPWFMICCALVAIAFMAATSDACIGSGPDESFLEGTPAQPGNGAQ